MSLSIQLGGLGKRYLREWIFRKVSLTISAGEKCVLLGANGSGKSTLLQVIANYQTATEGDINYFFGQYKIHPDKIFRELSIASPYLELIEDFTLIEAIDHQAIFKPFQKQIGAEDILEIAELGHAREKQIRFFSSGMKQRLKLTLAVLADCPLLLLDEPVSNLDRSAIEWYKKIIREHAMHKTIIVCSNKITEEYEYCTRQIEIEQFKPISN